MPRGHCESYNFERRMEQKQGQTYGSQFCSIDAEIKPMHFQRVQFIIILLLHSGHQSASQLATSGHLYGLISGNDPSNTIQDEKLAAYFECGKDDGCGYVGKDKSSGIFVKNPINEALNETRYAAIWKKRTSDINECASNPCPWGTCADRIAGYQCICPRGYYGDRCNTKIKSCTDIYRSGARKNGLFYILGAEDAELSVFCDLEAEANSTWTLLLYVKLANKDAFNFAYRTDHPRNSSSFNLEDYRLSTEHMQSIQRHTTLWRMTCDFTTYGVDYRDYVRGETQQVDIISFIGTGCRKLEYINVRGHYCSQCTAEISQKYECSLNIRSKSTACDFQGRIGAVDEEANFGCYNKINSAFRCTRNQDGSTQVWFGDYI